MANAADSYNFDASNVFNEQDGGWDLNPLAMKIGAGADGVRDTLSAKRDAFLQPKMLDYRNAVGPGKANATDSDLFNDQSFQAYVKTGQVPQAQGPQSVTQQWNAPATAAAAPQVAPAAADPRRDALFETLLKRSDPAQVTNMDPNVRAQSDANYAMEERARRNYINDTAERSGPNANLQGEKRMAAERMGQRTGSFEANLVGQEIKAQRDQVAQALTMQEGMLSDDQKTALQERLANLDAVLKQQGYALQDKGLDIQNQSVSNDMEKALLNNDATMRQLGLNEWDRTNYWDALKSGYLG
jgi:hypothetical protein